MLIRMFDRRVVRTLLTALMLGMLLISLAACGGAASVAADPETRVKDFFGDFQSAINDPDISQAGTQEKWATTLSSYVRPTEQADAKTQFQDALAELGGGLGAMAGQADADIRLQVTIENLTTNKQSESGNNAVVELTGGTMKFEVVGEDVEALGLPADQLSQTLPITEFAQEAGAGGDNTIELEMVDDVWYLILEQ